MNTRFLECGHAILCLDCAGRATFCPQCSIRIDGLSYEEDGEGVLLHHKTLAMHRRVVDQTDLEETFQIVLIGDDRGDKMSLLQSILDVCDIPDDHFVSSALPVRRWFRPNGQVQGRPVRFSVLEGVSWRDGEETLSHLMALKPDVVGICASVALTDIQHEFVKWTELLGDRGCALLWVLVQDKILGPGFSSDMTTFEDWLELRTSSEKTDRQFYISSIGGKNFANPIHIAQRFLNAVPRYEARVLHHIPSIY